MMEELNETLKCINSFFISFEIHKILSNSPSKMYKSVCNFLRKKSFYKFRKYEKFQSYMYKVFKITVTLAF